MYARHNFLVKFYYDLILKVRSKSYVLLFLFLLTPYRWYAILVVASDLTSDIRRLTSDIGRCTATGCACFCISVVLHAPFIR